MMGKAFLLALALLAQARVPEDLKAVAAEPNLVKRARLALTNGEQAAAKAGEACKASETAACDARLTEVQESVELAGKSLDESGIDARRSPRHFKDAEIRTRKILRQVEALRAYVQGDGLEHFEAVYRKISDINTHLLWAIMSKKKK